MAKATHFNLYDIAGKKVGTYDLAAQKTQLEIDLNDIQAGLYLLEWNTETDILAKQKLVVIFRKMLPKVMDLKCIF
mgnify:CR=1 FL=1